MESFIGAGLAEIGIATLTPSYLAIVGVSNLIVMFVLIVVTR